jgi:hypothetical protein
VKNEKKEKREKKENEKKKKEEDEKKDKPDVPAIEYKKTKTQEQINEYVKEFENKKSMQEK